ncbi:MAG: hypothetical protein JRD89_01165 [Deltaproteobacteria bacterium]|nr:hypothetical protein [Deltaproteobacteria bacterium]
MPARTRKRGRPRKKGGSKAQRRLRKLWREAQRRYYYRHREEILKRRRKTKGR